MRARMDKGSVETNEAVYQGIGINRRLSVGRLRFWKSEERKDAPSRSSDEPTQEWERLQAAIGKAIGQLEQIREKALRETGEGEAEIFEIHRMLLEDEDFLDCMRSEIDGGKCAEDALRTASARFCEMLRALNDPYLSARTADLDDVSRRVLQILEGSEETEMGGTDPYLLVADDLTPSQTVMLDKSRVLGFITFHGTPNSHTAILARAMGIPALIGTGEIDRQYDGALALLDAAAGTLTVCPTQEQLAAFRERQRADDRIAQDHERYLRSLLNKPAVTQSGHRMMIYANIGDGEEVDAAISNGADGIGLLRSEFLYLGADDYPSEEQLFDAYRSVAVKMQGKRAVIRTLDIGADKRISYFGLPEEENPALGFRAIRICLARRDLFKTQLRAILRASAFGRLSLMLPMVVSVDEVRQSRRLLEECMQELQAEGKQFDTELEFGIMIETPAAALMSRELAAQVDFFSVGTNDLVQYTLAADRQNPALSTLCQENREPVLRLIEMSAQAIHRTGGWIGICGEMAADLDLTQTFADLRIDELSVSVPYLLGVRGRVTECR